MTTQQYREVKRKAAVGERIKVVNAIGGYGYGNGDILIVKKSRDEDNVYFEHVVVQTSDISIANVLTEEYVVLEPIAEPAAPSPLRSDPLYAAFRQLILDNADAIRAILPQLEPQLSAEPPVRVAPVKLARAEVIAKATADVAELLSHNYPAIDGGEGAWLSKENDPFITVTDHVEFVVNRDKRTVTALLRYVKTNKVWRKSIAKCAPDDVFHAEIGKAIALRRALGLAVPTEYTDAPKPDEPHVGAKVFSATSWGTFTIAEDVSIAKRRMTSDCYAGLRDCDVHGSPRIIDDTDVDYSVAVTKGVAA